MNNGLTHGIILQHTSITYDKTVVAAAWSPGGQTLASVALTNTVCLWDAQTGKYQQIPGGETGFLLSVAWSPTGAVLAAGLLNGNICLIDAISGKTLQVLRGHIGRVRSVSWSSNGRTLASGASDNTIRLWDTTTGECMRIIADHTAPVYRVPWSPMGDLLASASDDQTVRLWDAHTGKCQFVFIGHTASVISVAWSSKPDTLASGSLDQTIRLWNTQSGECIRILEGHTDPVISVAWSHDSKLLATQTYTELWLWNTQSWEPVAKLKGTVKNDLTLAFHPKEALLAASSLDNKNEILVLQYDLDALLPGEATINEYSNAKVALVGDSGVGKSALAHALLGEPFKPTISTDGRNVWTINQDVVDLDDGRKQQRETILWDFAGNPGYRVYNQLHLSDITVALVVFDANSETNPLAGVEYWAHALDEATKKSPIVKILVAARSDRGTPYVSKDRIGEIRRKYHFVDYHETSALKAIGIEDLKQTIHNAVPWDKLTPISAPELFHAVKQFLVRQKESGSVLRTRDDLLKAFQMTRNQTVDQPTVDACIVRLKSAGLVRPLERESWILLQPEILDKYCARIAQAAGRENDGLGYLPEKNVLEGDFEQNSDAEGTCSSEEEAILLLAVVEEVIKRQIAWRQETEKGVMLVFPSEVRADIKNHSLNYAHAMVFKFKGPIRVIYTTLTVRLLNSIVFSKYALYYNTAILIGPQKQLCGYLLSTSDEGDAGEGQLTVFFGAGVSAEIKTIFLRYVKRQLEKIVMSGTLKSEQVYQCTNNKCEKPIIDNKIIQSAKKGRKRQIVCPLCAEPILLTNLDETSESIDMHVVEIEQNSQETGEINQRKITFRKKMESNQYDVFLCHNSQDKPEVRLLKKYLDEWGILAWIDEEGIPKGAHFIPAIEDILSNVPVMLYISGSNGEGRWQKQEGHAYYQRSVEHPNGVTESRPVIIPVLLPSAPTEPSLPLFLTGLNWVDFRNNDGFDNRTTMRTLVKGITERHPDYFP